MMKKTMILAALILMMTLSISVYAAETDTTEEISPQTEQNQQIPESNMPQGGMQGGRMRGGRGMPPGGMPPGGTPPTENTTGEENMNTPPPDMENFDPSRGGQTTEGSAGSQGNRDMSGMPGGVRGNMPGGMYGNMQESTEETAPEATQVEAAENEGDFLDRYSTPVLSVVLLGLAFVFVIFYKRKSF